jgi:2-haloacid dehalogenase
VSESYRTAIEAVVFDIGGVLLDWNPRHLYRQVFDDEAAMEYFLGQICTPGWHDDHDRGVSTVESCARLAAAHPEHADEIWAWARRGEEMVSGVLVENVDLLTELTEAGVACFALSNMEAETFPLRFEQFAFFRLFSGIVISGMEQMAKPDREIYELLLDRFGLESESTLYIDDNAGNLEPASALGMSTVHYQSPESLRRSLVDAGLPLRAPAGRNPDGEGHIPG